MASEGAPVPKPSGDQELSAGSIFQRWLEHPVGGGEPDFEALCRDHPEHEGELRHLRAAEKLLRQAGVVPISTTELFHSLAGHLKEKRGSEIDPHVSLHAESEPDEPPTSQLLTRLRAHALETTRYRLQGEIARGGMGAILKVWDEDLRRNLAMKVILGKSESSPEGETPPVDRRVLARFLEEAQVTGQLDHPGIVPVHELGLDQSGRVYFTMKLVKGRDLKTIFELVFAEQEGWNETRALGVLLKVCEAMAYAHAKGVIHRDLKPANVMVGNFGEVYIMDWGLARILGREDTHDLRILPEMREPSTSLRSDRREEREEAPDSPLFTMDGDVVGTPAYMPPEQARGEVERLGRRSDVYAIGAMLYHLLAQQMPYVAGIRISNRTVLARLIDGPPTPLRKLRDDVPAELESICEKAMAREPAARYADTPALAEDLRAFLEGRVVHAHRTGAVVELTKWVQRNKALASSIAAGFLALIAGLSASLVLKAQSDRNAKLAAEREELAENRRIEAEASKSRAETSETQAKEREKEARWQVYVTSLRAADAASHLNEPGNLRRALDVAPEDYRGWEWRHLDALADSSLLITRHDSGVLAVSFSADGSRFVTASFDETARVWDAMTGVEILNLRNHMGGVYSAAFSPDEKRIITTSMLDRTARVWDANTGDELLLLHATQEGGQGIRVDLSYQRAAAFSPDGSRIVTALLDNAASVWDAETGAEVFSLEGHQDQVWLASYSADNRHIVTASLDKTVRIWDAATGAEVFVLHDQVGDGYKAAVFSPNSSQIVTASDNEARIWDAKTGAELHVLRGHEPSSSINDVAFNHDGSRIVTASSDKTARIWDAQIGAELFALGGHDGPVEVALFSLDGSLILTGSGDGTARTWDAQSGSELAVLRGHEGRIRAASFSPDGSRIATGSIDGTSRIWNAKPEGGSIVQLRHGNVIQAAAFSPSNARIVTAGSDKTARVWDTVTGSELLVLYGHEGRVGTVSYSPDGTRIATGSWDQTARIWDAPTGAELLVLNGHEGSVDEISFSTDGSRIVTGSSDGTVRVWDTESGAELLLLVNDLGSVMTVSFSPDGLRILTETHVWDAKTGDKLLTLWQPQGSRFIAASFSPDGSRIIAVDRRSAHVLDAEQGTEVFCVHGQFLTARFNQDGSRIITASDKTARILDANTGSELFVLRGHDSMVTAASFSSDGSRIVTASADGTALIYDSIPYRVRYEERLNCKTVDREGRRAFDTLEPSCDNLIEVATKIRGDAALDPMVRSGALDLVTMGIHEASEWVSALYDELLFPEEVLRRVEADVSRRSEVKKHALFLARTLKVDAARCNSLAWEIVRFPDRSPEDCAKALVLIERAAIQEPRWYIINTLGIAQYRNGLYEESLATLVRSIELSKENPDELADPADIAFVAMAQFRLGQIEGAKASLRQLRELMQDAGNASSEDNQSFLREAEALIASDGHTRGD